MLLPLAALLAVSAAAALPPNSATFHLFWNSEGRDSASACSALSTEGAQHQSYQVFVGVCSLDPVLGLNYYLATPTGEASFYLQGGCNSDCSQCDNTAQMNLNECSPYWIPGTYQLITLSPCDGGLPVGSEAGIVMTYYGGAGLSYECALPQNGLMTEVNLGTTGNCVPYNSYGNQFYGYASRNFDGTYTANIACTDAACSQSCSGDFITSPGKCLPVPWGGVSFQSASLLQPCPFSTSKLVFHIFGNNNGGNDPVCSALNLEAKEHLTFAAVTRFCTLNPVDGQSHYFMEQSGPSTVKILAGCDSTCTHCAVNTVQDFNSCFSYPLPGVSAVVTLDVCTGGLPGAATSGLVASYVAGNENCAVDPNVFESIVEVNFGSHGHCAAYNFENTVTYGFARKNPDGSVLVGLYCSDSTCSSCLVSSSVQPGSCNGVPGGSWWVQSAAIAAAASSACDAAPCPSARAALAASSGSSHDGKRFGAATLFNQADVAFKTETVLTDGTTAADVQCACLTQCESNANCFGVYIKYASTFARCTGLTRAADQSLVSYFSRHVATESWSIPK